MPAIQLFNCKVQLNEQEVLSYYFVTFLVCQWQNTNKTKLNRTT